MENDTLMFLNALHGLGVLLAIAVDATRWAGICHDAAGRYWIIEGAITSTDELQENGLVTKDHCFEPSYEEALATFQHWWNRGFVGSPSCSGNGNGTGLRPI